MNNIKLSGVLLEDELYRKSLRKPPHWLLDKIADEKFNGGYKKSINKQCNVCFVLKSNNGKCNCD